MTFTSAVLAKMADVPCRKEQDAYHTFVSHPSSDHLQQSSTLLSLYDRSSGLRKHLDLSEVSPAEVRVMMGLVRMYVRLTLLGDSSYPCLKSLSMR